MFGLFLECFDWMPLPLTILCCGVVLIFMIVCLGHVIRALIDILRALLDIFGGMFGRVVGLFK